MLKAAANLLMPPADETARSIGDVTCITTLLGITYEKSKALPKINLVGLIQHMETSGHIGQKLQRQAERLGLRPTQVAELFGVKPPSVYDWYAHGRIHKKHYPVLVAQFGQPLEWWLDFAPAAQSKLKTDQPAGYSHAALELATLFDLIPARDKIRRAQAQVACGQVIIDLLQSMPAAQNQTEFDLKTPNT